MSQVKKGDINTVEKLSQILKEKGVNTSLWGVGEAKTLEHFYNEIKKGDSILVEGEEGELIREVIICGADIFYTSQEGNKYRLKEKKQVFYDGRERKRDYGHAVSEKLFPDENPEEGIRRGICEELGISGEISLSETKYDEIFRLSPSYPTLMSHYIRYNYEVELTEEQFNLEGYVEHGSTCITYFEWEEID
jgi:hypothetical protein